MIVLFKYFIGSTNTQSGFVVNLIKSCLHCGKTGQKQTYTPSAYGGLVTNGIDLEMCPDKTLSR